MGKDNRPTKKETKIPLKTKRLKEYWLRSVLSSSASLILHLIQSEPVET